MYYILCTLAAVRHPTRALPSKGGMPLASSGSKEGVNHCDISLTLIYPKVPNEADALLSHGWAAVQNFGKGSGLTSEVATLAEFRHTNEW